MKQLYPDLWQTRLYKSGMLNSYAYFLTRPEGNVLFYNTGNDDDLKQMADLGGIKYQLLTHRDEAGASLNRIREQFGSQLMFSELEAPAIARYAYADQLFEPVDSRLENIDVLFTPGHTDGSVCFLYHSPYGQSYLFTGDTFFQWDGRWRSFVINGFGGSEAAAISSLKKLLELTPDVVMSSGFIGNTGLVELKQDEWTKAIGSEITRLSGSY